MECRGIFPKSLVMSGIFSQIPGDPVYLLNANGQLPIAAANPPTSRPAGVQFTKVLPSFLATPPFHNFERLSPRNLVGGSGGEEGVKLLRVTWGERDSVSECPSLE